jgi:hypothetical protein
VLNELVLHRTCTFQEIPGLYCPKFNIDWMFFESSSSTFCAEFATWFSLPSTILELNIGTFKQLPSKFIMSSIEWSWNLCLPSTDLFKCVITCSCSVWMTALERVDTFWVLWTSACHNTNG